VLDPTFTWHDHGHPEPTTLLAHRYQVILDSFSARFVGAVESMAEVLDSGGTVAYHCAVGKDRTGLLTALVLDTLGASDDAQCGRVVLSDIHVSPGPPENDYSSPQTRFPDGCITDTLSPQEAVLAFMLFDLSSCVQPEDQPVVPPTIIR
jgi:hypothetical protein